MTIANLKIGKREYVLIPKREYERLQRRCESAKGKQKRLNAKDQADLEIATKRLNDPKEKRVAWSEVKKAAGLA